MAEVLLIVIDRPEFEKRLAAYLAGRPMDEQIAFLIRHGVWATGFWSQSRLMKGISEVLQAQADLAIGAMAQHMLIVSSKEVV